VTMNDTGIRSAQFGAINEAHSGVKPLSLVFFTSAPAPSRSMTISSCPALTNVGLWSDQRPSERDYKGACSPAICSAVHPLGSALSTCAFKPIKC
jgi:hypothetical protein